MNNTNKKDKAIMFCATQDYKFALATIITNLQDKNRECYNDIVVYHDTFSQKDIQDLQKIEPNIVFRRYTINDFKNEHTFSGNLDNFNRFINRFSHLALIKYKIFELLQHYKKVLFLDLDMLILGNIEELFQIDGIAWRNEDNLPNKFNKFGDNNKPSLEGFDKIPADYPHMNGGLFYATDVINYQKCEHDAKEFIQTYAPYFQNSVDELAISYVSYKNNLPLTSLNPQIYNVYPKIYTYHSKIIHFPGWKPWNDEYRQLAFPQWIIYYHKCASIADCYSNKVIDFGSLGQKFRKMENEGIWIDFLNKTKLNITNRLKIRFEFHTEKLYLDFHKNIFFEFTNHRSNNFSLSFIAESWDIVFDKDIINYFSNLAEKNKEFALIIDKNRLVFSSRIRNIEQIPILWTIFYKKCEPILEKL